MIYGIQQSKGKVCIKFVSEDGKTEVSLAIDDSCKMALPTRFIRNSMCIQTCDNDTNITEDHFGVEEVYYPSIEQIIEGLMLLLPKKGESK